MKNSTTGTNLQRDKAVAVCTCAVLNATEGTNSMSVLFRKWFSEEQKLQSSCSVFGSAVCSSADCSHSAVCHTHSRETQAHIQEWKPNQWERPANTQEHKPDQ